MRMPSLLARVAAVARTPTAMALLCAAVCLPPPAGAAGFDLLNAGVEGRIGERTVLGKDSPESFNPYDVRASWSTPWEHAFESGAVFGLRLLGSAGLIEGPDKNALVASLVPVIALGTLDRRLTVDGGLGLALLSEHRYAQQDFGGPAQFALTVGLGAPLYRRVGLSYRFMHYSDAGLYGGDTIGADLHMAGLSYRF